MAKVKRLRMFAGPNGSGKSTLFRSLAREHSSKGVFHGLPFVNADDLEREWQETGTIDLTRFNLPLTAEKIRIWLTQSTWTEKLIPEIESLELSEMLLRMPRTKSASYVTAALADYLRRELLKSGRSFSFETVMSHPSKIDFFAKAKAEGYRLYLYFVATGDPELNMQRVRVRVQDGGHSVPKQKILERFGRSLELLPAAVRHADRAFLFDNSGTRHLLVAEVTAPNVLTRHLAEQFEPEWFRNFADGFRG